MWNEETDSNDVPGVSQKPQDSGSFISIIVTEDDQRHNQDVYLLIEGALVDELGVLPQGLTDEACFFFICITSLLEPAQF